MEIVDVTDRNSELLEKLTALWRRSVIKTHTFLFAVISFVLTYLFANPQINRFYKNKTLSFGKRLLWQTLIYFLILIVITALFTLCGFIG